jgi:DNA-binding LacI/PurR family transcriptional regulator
LKNSQPTIRDIAIRLNIAISTVSRALRNAPDVNPETKRAVLELAKQLNYEPNRVAQSLRIKRTNTLGVIVPEIVMHFFSSAISGIQEYAASHNYSTMICQSIESYTTEKSNIQMLLANRVDGLLISLSSSTQEYEHLQQLIDRKIPIVLFDRVVDSLPVSKVVVDDFEGSFKAVSYLIKTGCSRIAYIGGPKSLLINEKREHGYREALKKGDLSIDESLILNCKDLHAPDEAVLHLLSNKALPDAIFCMNDPVAIRTMTILKEKEIKIPQQISIVGFTNEPVSQFIEPSLTTVAQPAYDIGKTAAQLFLEQINFGERFEPVTKILPTSLIIRNSTRQV